MSQRLGIGKQRMQQLREHTKRRRFLGKSHRDWCLVARRLIKRARYRVSREPVPSGNLLAISDWPRFHEISRWSWSSNGFIARLWRRSYGNKKRRRFIRPRVETKKNIPAFLESRRTKEFPRGTSNVTCLESEIPESTNESICYFLELRCLVYLALEYFTSIKIPNMSKT